MKYNIIPYLASILISIVLSISLMQYFQNEPKQVYSLDMHQIMLDYTKLTNRDSVNTTELNNKFGKMLKVYLDALSKKNNAIIVMKPAIVTGAIDITKDVEKTLFAQLKTRQS